MTDCTIGIDLGSTSIKGVLYSQSSDEVLHVESHQISPRVATIPTRYEEDPLVIRDAAFQVIHALARKAKKQGVRVVRLAATGQMHGGLLVDALLNPVTNFITWQDQRGDERKGEQSSLITRLRDSVAPDVMSEIGGDIHTGYLCVTIASLQEEGGVPAVANVMLGIYDWIACLLTDAEPSTDVTSAAAWGMYSIVRKQWLPEIVNATHIRERLLPRVLEPGTILGLIAPDFVRQLELPSDVEIVMGLGDTQASYVGSGAHSDQIVLNFGTGSQSMWETEDFFPSPGTDLRYLSTGRYLVTAPTLAGGLAYQLLARFYSEVFREFGGGGISLDQCYETMDRLARSSGSSGGVTFSPLFNGSRFLGENELATISGLTRENFHPGTLIYALLEGMVEEIAVPFFLREEDVTEFTSLVGSGNGMRKNVLLREIASRRFGLPIVLSKHAEEAAVGAAMVAYQKGTAYP